MPTFDTVCWWIGFLVICLATLSLVTFLVGLVFNQVWRKIKDDYALDELQSALRMYGNAAKIEKAKRRELEEKMDEDFNKRSTDETV